MARLRQPHLPRPTCPRGPRPPPHPLDLPPPRRPVLHRPLPPPVPRHGHPRRARVLLCPVVAAAAAAVVSGAASRFASTLCSASFGFCHFSEETARTLVFPVLKNLVLREVSISEESLSLVLSETFGFRSFRLVSPSLRSIGVVIAAPKLEALGWLPDARPRLNLGIDVPRELKTNTLSLTMVMRSVKILALRTLYLSLDVGINLMACFPCLTSLYISSIERGDEESNVRHIEQLGHIECIKHHLKKIVNFVKFFVLNARVLQLMRLELPEGCMHCKWMEMLPELLQIKDRACDANFDFCTDGKRWLSCPVSLKRVTDLSRADPFV
ncbi:hypothetical protein HU200_015594 [Digitaria exilis]|uniref:F-box/LRR-repeat protein 15/At3g58940/PEG3-like LRR domain-containing protein n=1 Tax=Digitaria exilis TaxID=1010633 RepID=A0A835KHD0_9POAL|nr:hypothetical protein HU200_015594 [Digitaria exilis]